MYLSAEKKKEIFSQYGSNEKDTGKEEGQVGLFTYRIAHLTKYLKKNKKDFVTQKAVKKLVGKRRYLLSYLYKRDIGRYRKIIEKLKLSDIFRQK